MKKASPASQSAASGRYCRQYTAIVYGADKIRKTVC